MRGEFVHGVEPWSQRKPEPEEMAAAAGLSKRLLSVTYPARGYTYTPSMRPPGRLVVNQAMRLRQQRNRGEIPSAKPFLTRKMETAIHTPIKCGFGFDGSGSQSGIQEAVGVVRYVTTDALQRVHGEVAAVQFKSRAIPIQAPGERVPMVERYGTGGGSENFREAFAMLDGALDLLDGEGARLLVVVTDGIWSDHQIRFAEEVMQEARRKRLAVVWVDSGNGFARPDAFGFGEIIRTANKRPAQVADLIGDAIIRQFRLVAPQHSLMAA